MCFICSIKSSKCKHFLQLYLHPCKHRREYDAYCPHLTVIPEAESPLFCPECFEIELTKRLERVKAEQDGKEAEKEARRAYASAQAEVVTSGGLATSAEVENRPLSARRIRHEKMRRRVESRSPINERALAEEILDLDEVASDDGENVTARERV